MMSDLLSLLALDQATRGQIEARNPYRAPAAIFDQVGSAALQAGDNYSTGEKIGTALLSGLLGGAITGLGNDYQGRAENEFLSALRGGSESSLIGPSLFNTANQRRSLFQTIDGLNQRDLLNEFALKERAANQDSIRSIREKAAEKLFSTNPYERKQAETFLRGLAGEDVLGSREPMAVSAEESGMASPALNDRFAKREAELYDFYLQKGFPETQAAIQARTGTQDERKRIEEQYKGALEAGKAGRELLQMTSQIEDALSRAGDTGLFGNARNVGAQILGGVFPSQGDKASAGEIVNSFGAQIVSRAREVGSGPMSDRDVALYLSSGPTLNKTEGANAAILDRFKYAATLQKAYGDFMLEQQAQGVPALEAERAWNQLRDENPYLISGEGGGLQPNPQWARALSSVSVPSAFATGGQANIPTQSTSAQPGLSREAAIAELKRRGKL